MLPQRYVSVTETLKQLATYCTLFLFTFFFTVLFSISINIFILHFYLTFLSCHVIDVDPSCEQRATCVAAWLETAGSIIILLLYTMDGFLLLPPFFFVCVCSDKPGAFGSSRYGMRLSRSVNNQPFQVVATNEKTQQYMEKYLLWCDKKEGFLVEEKDWFAKRDLEGILFGEKSQRVKSEESFLVARKAGICLPSSLVKVEAQRGDENKNIADISMKISDCSHPAENAAENAASAPVPSTTIDLSTSKSISTPSRPINGSSAPAVPAASVDPISIPVILGEEESIEELKNTIRMQDEEICRYFTMNNHLHEHSSISLAPLLLCFYIMHISHPVCYTLYVAQLYSISILITISPIMSTVSK